MLDGLRDLFLAALTFDGDDAVPLVIKWNKEINRIQTVFDRMTDKGVDAVPVVRCKDCRYCWKMRPLTPDKEDEWTMWCMRYLSESYACLTTPEDYCSHGRKSDG